MRDLPTWTDNFADALEGRLPHLIRPPARLVYNWAQLLWFIKLKKSTNGMLLPKQYKLIYNYASGLSDYKSHNMLEVGGAHGSGTIAMASGIKNSGSDGEVFTFERMEGGSRAEYGGKDENLRIFTNNIKEYGVEDYVNLIPRGLTVEEDTPDVIENNAPYAMLLHDADARIYRDFEHFYDLLLPGSIIIVDDYSSMERNNNGKNYESYGYISHFIQQGYVEKIDTVGKLFIGMKPLDAETIEIDYDEITKIQEHMSEFVDPSRFAFQK